MAAGCASRDNPEEEFSFFGSGRVNVGGSNQMLDAKFERFNDMRLIAMLDPDDDLVLFENGQVKAGRVISEKDVERAFQIANQIGYPRQKKHRNEIQDQLILASQQSCNFYKDHLRRLESYKSFFLGTLTTVLGGASAIVTGAGGARALGGAAGITSGINAEFDQAFFKNLAIHVITPGIDSRRDKKLKEIRKNRKNKTIKQYNVQAAIRDALDYHNQCTLNTGMEEAADSIRTVRDPGLKAAQRTAIESRRLRRILGADDEELFSPEFILSVGTALAPQAVIFDEETLPSEALRNALASINGAVGRFHKQIAAKAKEIKEGDEITPEQFTKKLNDALDELFQTTKAKMEKLNERDVGEKFSKNIEEVTNKLLSEVDKEERQTIRVQIEMKRAKAHAAIIVDLRILLRLFHNGLVESRKLLRKEDKVERALPDAIEALENANKKIKKVIPLPVSSGSSVVTSEKLEPVKEEKSDCPRFSKKSPPKGLLEALKTGGTVIVVRHAEDEGGRDNDNCAKPGKKPELKKPGKDKAKEIGEKLKSAGVEIGDVSASPLKRTMQTAIVAFPDKTVKNASELCLDKATGFKGYLTAEVTKAKTGSNAFLVTHRTNLEGLFTKMVDTDFKFSDGIVVKAEAGKEGFVCLGRINAADWAALK